MQNVKNPILELSFEFAIEIIAYCEKLEAKRKYVIAHQLLKSGTSIGANIREAQHPHSRADFIAKMVIASKEASETEYWLLLYQRSESYPNTMELQGKLIELKKLLSRIITSAKRKYNEN